ncbi:MAG: type III-B CRISPR module RAMP protein Cmr4 [Alphaproteobacteria bacterium]|nr:type III-B CRISPR module RAMP protein Cmr4 [Alphaproteobacteria bacterium]
MNHRLYIVHALSPVHPGTGQGVGLIDLPVARERATEHPVLPGSSVKGVLRDRARQLLDGGRETPEGETWKLFGPDTQNASSHGAAVQVSDARVLLFPVQSDRGTFAWVTCRYVLERLCRDALSAGRLSLDDLPQRLKPGTCVVGALETLAARGRQVVLDGLPFEASPSPIGRLADQLAALVFPTDSRDALKHYKHWSDALRDRLCVVDDDSFTWFVRNATEVRARVRLDPDTGTVAPGGLWYEESLPTETVLAGLLRLEENGKVRDLDAAWGQLSRLVRAPLQVGGHASTGQGLARVLLHGEAR